MNNATATGISAEPVTAETYGSNAIRLTLREWWVCALLVAIVAVAVPRLGGQQEAFEAGAGYRVPFALSDDYWTYQRGIDEAVARGQIPIVGDSVVWGEYVEPGQALSDCLNRQSRDVQFANCGLNGSHPLALAGLVRYYARRLRQRPVILHGNLLWMSSAERDLQTENEVDFNHPTLVPQFWPRIPAYKATAERRMGNCIDRSLGLRHWVRHVRIQAFENMDLPSWSLEHPYTDPFSQLEFRQTLPLNEPHSPPISWIERGIVVQDIPWIDLETSFQWQAFQRIVALLEQRECKLFVVLGPLNEHLLSAGSQQRYQRLKQVAAAWLTSQGVSHLVADLLPSSEYGDASHPLAAGYQRLANRLHGDAEFQRWLQSVGTPPP